MVCLTSATRTGYLSGRAASHRYRSSGVTYAFSKVAVRGCPPRLLKRASPFPPPTPPPPQTQVRVASPVSPSRRLVARLALVDAHALGKTPLPLRSRGGSSGLVAHLYGEGKEACGTDSPRVDEGRPPARPGRA